MGFPESIKKEVRERAAFQCCRCHKVGIEVHHIIPEEYGGADDIGNAAPLCPNCHDDFRANPEKRKAIFEMREWWYNRVKVIYGPPVIPMKMLEKLNENLIKWGKGLSDFNNEIKPLLRKATETVIDTVTPSTESQAVTGVISMTLPPLQAEVYGRANHILCKGCEELVDYENNYCPKCGTKLRIR